MIKYIISENKNTVVLSNTTGFFTLTLPSFKSLGKYLNGRP
jgi:hypothetical protein